MAKVELRDRTVPRSECQQQLQRNGKPAPVERSARARPNGSVARASSQVQRNYPRMGWCRPRERGLVAGEQDDRSCPTANTAAGGPTVFQREAGPKASRSGGGLRVVFG